MNVYEKLNKARLEFQKLGIKQNGKNDFAKYSYFELSDILPAVNKINNELNVAVVVSFRSEIAMLEFIDCEKPEDKIVFTSPMSEANLKGCHAVQNLGAVESYIKRYLYQNCFEIAESTDILDSTMNPQDNTKHTTDSELNKLKVTVQDAINRGQLKGNYLTRAREVMRINDKEALRKLVDYLVSQEIPA